MSKTIQITFNPDGTTEIKTSGFRGNSCMMATEFLKKALGSVLNTKKTPEYFQAEAVDKQLAAGEDPGPLAGRRLAGVFRATSINARSIRRDVGGRAYG